MSQTQFSLLGKRRFLPFFVTQSLGAFNDNIFKQSLILAILYKLTIDGDRSIYVNLCALLFILPFFLFSALAGQFGEKYPKDKLIRMIKVLEIGIMVVGAVGFLFDHLSLMLAALFAMGTHSALFGPVKYSILPQHLHENELVGGNGLVEMGTFLAILAGTIGAGIMMSATHYAPIVSTAMVLVACLGYLASRGIPPAAAASPGLRLNWNIFSESWATLKLGLNQTKAVSLSQNSQHAEAIPILERIVDASPQDLQRHMNMFILAIAYASEGRRSEARAAVEKAIELDPTWHQPHMFEAMLYGMQGRFSAAAAKVADARRLEPDLELEGYVYFFKKSRAPLVKPLLMMVRKLWKDSDKLLAAG